MTARIEVVVFSDQPSSVNFGVPLDPRPQAADGVLSGSAPDVARLSQLNHALRVTVDEANLGAAQHSMVGLLELLSAAHHAARLTGSGSENEPLAVDLFCLDVRSLSDQIERLRRCDVASKVLLRVTKTPMGTNIQSLGFSKLKSPEVVVEVDEAHVGAGLVFLNDVVAYLDRASHFPALPTPVLKAGDRATFGWVNLRFAAADALVEGWSSTVLGAEFLRAAAKRQQLGLLVACEPQTDGPQPTMVRGASRAARTYDAMVSANQQVGSSELQIPRAEQTVVVCKQALGAACLSIRRAAPDEALASGWVAICADGHHDHSNAHNFEIVELWQLAAAQPSLFCLLALPVGYGVLMADGALTIQLAD